MLKHPINYNTKKQTVLNIVETLNRT